VKRLVLLVAAVACVGMLASPAMAQQETPTDGATEDTETVEESTPLPVQSPSGSPVTYESPTPTSSGSGPGFGTIGALVAAALAAVLAVRRRT
jgi:PGF-CTERM protein